MFVEVGVCFREQSRDSFCGSGPEVQWDPLWGGEVENKQRVSDGPSERWASWRMPLRIRMGIWKSSQKRDWRVSAALGLELLGMVCTAELGLSLDRGRTCRFAFCPWLFELGEHVFSHSQLSSVRGAERSLGDILFWNSFTGYKWRLENCIILRKLSSFVGALPEFWMPFELFFYWIFPSDFYF